MASVLGVERSIGGRCWQPRLADERLGVALAQRHDLPELLGRVLAGRGVSADDAEIFLNPSLRHQLPDPSHLKDMDAAVARICDAVQRDETIALFGDYDVDGATSAALLYRAFASCGGKVRFYIPDRLREGYGPNGPALLALGREGATVIVTLDCGTLAHAPLAAAADSGLDVIVVDHHMAEPALPRAHAVVNPNRLDETSPHRHLAAVGVAFLLAVAVNRRLRTLGWFNHRQEPDLLDLLDLVALGTVADVVPLIGLNRAFVAQGLKVMAGRRNLGLAALADVAGIRQMPDAFTLGFALGPRVNAGGRVGESDLGVRILTTEDATEAAALARRLDGFNRERQSIEAAMVHQAMAAVEAGPEPGPLILVAQEGWHPGVVGIVASRLKDRYQRPVCVVALENGVGRGSGRSIEGIDLGAAVIAARQAGLLRNGGGHAMAAGFTLEEGQIQAFRDFLIDRVGTGFLPRSRLPTLSLDGALALAAATPDFVEKLARLAPFGAGNPEPRFAVIAARVAKADVVGESHLRCFLADGQGGRLGGICFRSVGTELGKALRETAGAPLHLAGHLRADIWQGETRVQLHIEDAAPALPK